MTLLFWTLFFVYALGSIEEGSSWMDKDVYDFKGNKIDPFLFEKCLDHLNSFLIESMSEIVMSYVWESVFEYPERVITSALYTSMDPGTGNVAQLSSDYKLTLYRPRSTPKLLLRSSSVDALLGRHAKSQEFRFMATVNNFIFLAFSMTRIEVSARSSYLKFEEASEHPYEMTPAISEDGDIVYRDQLRCCPTHKTSAYCHLMLERNINTRVPPNDCQGFQFTSDGILSAIYRQSGSPDDSWIKEFSFESHEESKARNVETRLYESNQSIVSITSNQSFVAFGVFSGTTLKVQTLSNGRENLVIHMKGIAVIKRNARNLIAQEILRVDFPASSFFMIYERKGMVFVSESGRQPRIFIIKKTI